MLGQKRWVLCAEVCEQVVHWILCSVRVPYKIGVLSCTHEYWKYKEVWTAPSVLFHVKLVRIDEERFPVLQILFYYGLPIIENGIFSLSDKLIIVYFLGSSEIFIGTCIVCRWKYSQQVLFVTRGVVSSKQIKPFLHFTKNSVEVVMHSLVLSSVPFCKEHYKIIEAHHPFTLPIGEVPKNLRSLLQRFFFLSSFQTG